MIELTEAQARAIAQAGPEPPGIVDPLTRTAYVLLREDEYERLKELLYDDSPWTDEEMDALAVEAGQSLGWDDGGEAEADPGDERP
jgi:hypothetical protein